MRVDVLAAFKEVKEWGKNMPASESKRNLPNKRYIKDPDNEEHRQLFDVIGKMLEYDPSNRVNLKQSLRHAFFRKYYEEELLKEPENSQSNGDRERSHSLSR